MPRPTVTQVAEMHRLAMEIADESSAVLIELNGVQIRDKIGRVRWYELDSTDKNGWPYVERALRYLTLRGKLRRQKEAPNRVKVVL